MANFAITGVAGYIAPRHLRAIAETGNRVVAALDPHDAVGVLDRYSFDTRYFSEFERFDRHLEKLRRGSDGDRIQYLTICAPNHLHDAHARLALRLGATAICEKPLVINPWNLDALQDLERESGGARIFTILQLRMHPGLIALKARLDAADRMLDVTLTYVTPRGEWYLNSWKGSEERSGGIITNIGIHLFDVLAWIFGALERSEVHARGPRRAAGLLLFQKARVRWLLSIDRADLALCAGAAGGPSCRSLTVDGDVIEFSDGFSDLHTEVYRRTLAGQGFGIDDARPSIEIAHRIRSAAVVTPKGDAHHGLAGVTGV